jgi:hypothetical protein
MGRYSPAHRQRGGLSYRSLAGIRRPPCSRHRACRVHLRFRHESTPVSRCVVLASVQAALGDLRRSVRPPHASCRYPFAYADNRHATYRSPKRIRAPTTGNIFRKQRLRPSVFRGLLHVLIHNLPDRQSSGGLVRDDMNGLPIAVLAKRESPAVARCRKSSMASPLLG